MRPVTTLEKRVDSLSRTVRDLTPAQREWGLFHILPHHCVHWTRTGKSVCVDCGHVWKGEKPDVCPHCGAKLKVTEDSRKRVFRECFYYGIIQKVREFTVVRIFYVTDTRRLGDPARDTEFHEILQHWIDETGRDIVRSLRIAMFPYYRYCPFSLWSEMSLKRYVPDRHPYYHIEPDGYYPRMSYSATLKRNGFQRDFHGLNPENVLSHLLCDNRFETLWKTGRISLAGTYLRGNSEKVRRRWKPLMRLPALAYDETLILLDYMDLLEYFHKDPVTFNYPDITAIREDHDRLVERRERLEEMKRLEELRRREQERLAVLESKSKYFGITFGNERMTVIVLKTIEDYMDEGRRQKHCVFTNAYYGKPDTLILSARMRDNPSKPVETVEVSLKDGDILQCFGKCNKFTSHHNEIMELVKRNSWRFLKAR